MPDIFGGGELIRRLIGGGLMGAAGALAPVAPKYDRMNTLLSGTDDQRNQQGSELTGRLMDWSKGKGVFSSPAVLAARASGGLSRLGKMAKNIHQGINMRSIGRGQGPGSGMTEAGHLKTDIGGLDASRRLMGQLQSSDLQSGKQMQQQGAGMLGSILKGDQQTAQDEEHFAHAARREHELGGTDAYRGALGFAHGFWGLGMPGANDPFGGTQGQV